MPSALGEAVRRREFIALLGSAAAAWPLAAGSEQLDRVRRIGVLNGLAETDAETQTYDAAFRKRLDELGWVDGRNIHIDYRWGAGSVERMRLFAKELVQLNPEVIFTFTTPASAALHAETSTIPIVFSASDPIGSGFVASLANPGGNMTGTTNFEASLGSKWLELLHDVAPRVSRVAIMFNPDTAPFARYYLRSIGRGGCGLPVETAAIA
jgi:putative ABC transport system substrate-binding protein